MVYASQSMNKSLLKNDYQAQLGIATIFLRIILKCGFLVIFVCKLRPPSYHVFAVLSCENITRKG